jgi:hypothetical protein
MAPRPAIATDPRRPRRAGGAPPGTRSRQTLAEVPGRALAFLRAVGTRPGIREALATVGFRREDHEEGWKLLSAACAWGERAAPYQNADDGAVREATEAIATWLRVHIPRLRLGLERMHPDQAAYVFDGLERTPRRAALVQMGSLLSKLDALETSPDRAGTREADAAALGILETRGLGRQERARLAALLERAQSFVAKETAEVEPRGTELVALHRWYVEWLAAARVAVKRGDYLRALGVGR